MISFTITLTYLQIYLLIINIFSFVLYGYDKAKALQTTKKPSRISELNLLLSSLMGGSIGSLIAMVLFRHKIKKISFYVKFGIVVAIQSIILYSLYK